MYRPSTPLGGGFEENSEGEQLLRSARSQASLGSSSSRLFSSFSQYSDGRSRLLTKEDRSLPQYLELSEEWWQSHIFPQLVHTSSSEFKMLRKEMLRMQASSSAEKDLDVLLEGVYRLAFHELYRRMPLFRGAVCRSGSDMEELHRRVEHLTQEAGASAVASESWRQQAAQHEKALRETKSNLNIVTARAASAESRLTETEARLDQALAQVRRLAAVNDGNGIERQKLLEQLDESHLELEKKAEELETCQRQFDEECTNSAFMAGRVDSLNSRLEVFAGNWQQLMQADSDRARCRLLNKMLEQEGVAVEHGEGTDNLGFSSAL